MKAVLFANGDIHDYNYYETLIDSQSIIICLDGGVRHAQKLGLIPQMILGDLDSADEEILQYYRKRNVPFRTFPAKKDKTDMEIGLEYAVEIGAKEIVILGAIGSRIDHSLGNLHLLKIPLGYGIDAEIINEHNRIRLINQAVKIAGKPGDLVSLIPLTTEVTGVTTKGLEYALHQAVLTVGSSYGISNVMTDAEAEVLIQSGLLLIIQSQDPL